jgi:hypothetical protein
VRPDALDYLEVSTGVVLDTVTLVDGQLSFATGAATQLFTTRTGRYGWTAERTYDQLVSWSNGYAALRPR